MFRPDDLEKELLKQPFEPFRVHVSDGTSYEIRHPDFVRVSPSRVIIFVPVPNRSHQYFEQYDSVALIHITRLEPIRPSVSPTTN